MQFIRPEYFLIILVIFLQLMYFRKTKRKIKQLSTIYPNKDELNVKSFNVADSTGKVIRTFGLIEKKDNWNQHFIDIIDNANSYLEKNKGNVADFNILKDISERINDKLESEIGSTLAIPLYIGLLGTMLGIVYGLFGMGTDYQQLSPESISPLLGGVKLAMIGSFTGLLLTLINSAFLFRDAKFSRDRCQDDYYTFIQVNLLPTLAINLESNLANNLMAITDKIEKISVVLESFSGAFKQNNAAFQVTMETMVNALSSEVEYINSLKQLNFNEISKSLIEAYQGINEGLSAYRTFSEYQEKLNEVMASSTTTITKFEDVYDKVISTENNISGIFTNIRNQILGLDKYLKLLDSQQAGMDGMTDKTRDLMSKQEENLRNIYGDFAEFMRVIKEKFTDLANQMSSEATNQLTVVSEGVEKSIETSFDSYQLKLDTLYAGDALNEVKQNMRILREAITEVKAGNVKYSEITAITPALSELSRSMKSMEVAIKGLSNQTRHEKTPNGYGLVVKETLIKISLLGGAGGIGYLIYRAFLLIQSL